MFKKVLSSAVWGIDGRVIGIEVDISDGLPTFSMVGYLSSSVKESAERVRIALKNSNIYLPPKRITVNLTPADIRKDGSGFDLPIATALLMCLGIEPEFTMDNFIILGELGLNGLIKPIAGILPMLCHCYEHGYNTCIIPYDNINEAMLINGLKVIGLKSISSLIEFMLGNNADFIGIGGQGDIISEQNCPDNIDFSEIKGQEVLKRGMEIAAAGFHNVLMTGAAGAGKSMIAKRLSTIIPKLTFEENLEITKIYSVSGLLLNSNTLVNKRPFRSPHHTVTSQSLIGGGIIPKPGEVSLAHNGVLFLDELPEFKKSTLEVLRQPLEDRKVSISRVNATYVFPSDFMLVAAMNPCPCGNYPNLRKCKCTPHEIKRYQSKISGPLMDRIDITMEVKPLSYNDIFEISEGESSEKIRERVEKARFIQANRYKGEVINFNSQLDGGMVRKYISLNSQCEDILKSTFQNSDLSARGIYRILKLSRTIADLEGNEEISPDNLGEAIFYRNVSNNEGGNNESYI